MAKRKTKKRKKTGKAKSCSKLPCTLKPSNKQIGSSNIKYDKRKRALPPGKRISRSGRVYYEYRKNRSDKNCDEKPGCNKRVFYGALITLHYFLSGSEKVRGDSSVELRQWLHKKIQAVKKVKSCRWGAASSSGSTLTGKMLCYENISGMARKIAGMLARKANACVFLTLEKLEPKGKTASKTVVICPKKAKAARLRLKLYKLIRFLDKKAEEYRNSSAPGQARYIELEASLAFNVLRSGSNKDVERKIREVLEYIHERWPRMTAKKLMAQALKEYEEREELRRLLKWHGVKSEW